MIGIAITTRNRYRVLQLCLSRFNLFTPKGATIVIVDDNSKDTTETLCRNTLTDHAFTHIYMPRQVGISLAKNECLRRLNHCDHIFLFDDDCFPKKDGWAEYYIDTAKATGNHHLIHSKPDALGVARMIRKDDKVISLTCGTGCLMYMDSDVLDKVGGFNPDYSYYGHEHLGYTLRIHRAGLNPSGAFLTPVNAAKYVHSLDVDGIGEYQGTLGANFGSCDSYNLRAVWVNQGKKVFQDEASGKVTYIAL